MRPVVHDTTEVWYSSIGSGLTTDDETTDWHLLRWLDALGALLGAIDDVVRDSEDGSGWTGTFDVLRAENHNLGYLGQFAGVRLPDGLADAAKRAYIQDHPYWDRGTPGALKDEIKPTLTGTRRAAIHERAGGAYRLEVLTHPDDTPDAPGTLAAILRQKPGGLALTYSASVSLSIQGLGGKNPLISIDELVGAIDDLQPTWETL